MPKVDTNDLQYSHNQPVLSDGLSICFQYPGSPPCDLYDIARLAESAISGTLPPNPAWITP